MEGRETAELARGWTAVPALRHKSLHTPPSNTTCTHSNKNSVHPHLVKLHPQDWAELYISLLDGYDRLGACETHAFPRLAADTPTPPAWGVVLKCETILRLVARCNPSLSEQLRTDGQLRQTLSKADVCLVLASTGWVATPFTCRGRVCRGGAPRNQGPSPTLPYPSRVSRVRGRRFSFFLCGVFDLSRYLDLFYDVIAA